MHWQIEDDDRSLFVAPKNVVDLQFNIECKALPVDHAYALAAAIQPVLLWFGDDETATLHLIHGADTGNGWERPEASDELIYLSRRTKLVLRVSVERVDDAKALIGQTLDVAGNAMIISTASIRPLSTTTSLYSRYIVVEPGEDEEAFLKRIIAEIHGMGLQFQKVICGKEHALQLPEGKLVTRSMLVADIGFDDSIRLQERGVGAKMHKKLGCGLFIAHKTV